MLSTLDLLIIGAYFALMIALGWYMRKQKKKNALALPKKKVSDLEPNRARELYLPLKKH